MPQQPEINTIRVAYQALASVLGGVQSMFTCALDEPFSIPTEENARLALRIQQVLGFETGAVDTPDPLGGSYYVESLTKEMEDKIEDLIENIESRGGMVESIKEGVIQREILEEAYKSELQTRSGEKVIVGRNGFFGMRLEEICRSYGLEVVRVGEELGQRLHPEPFREALEQNPDAVLLALVHLETSTAVLNPLREIAEIARSYDVPVAVDAVSSLGGVELEMDAWGIDLCAAATQKCLGA